MKTLIGFISLIVLAASQLVGATADFAHLSEQEKTQLKERYKGALTHYNELDNEIVDGEILRKEAGL